MKIIFSLLLLFNILFAITVNYQSDQQKNESVLSVYNPEKVNLLPAYVDCIAWTDFTEQQLQQAKRAINKIELKKPYKLVSSGPKIKFWVHTSPYENQQAAEREINKLRNMGIISYRVQEEGPWLNAISFGILGNQDTANSLVNKLAQKGITKVTISKREIEHQKFLFFETDRHKIHALQNLATQFPDSRLVHTTCERL